MKLIAKAFTLLVILIAFHSATHAGRIPIDQITFDLKKLEAENIGIAIWDQREMVVDGSQPESFLGYLRALTGISYGQITKSQRSLTEVLSAKIQEAYQAKGSQVGIIKTNPFNTEEVLIDRIKNSPYDKVLVIKLNNFIFDGVAKVEYVVDIECKIYSQDGQTLSTDYTLYKTPMGSSGKVKKTVPAQIKTSMEKLLNDSQIHNTNLQVPAPKTTLASDLLITKQGDELEVKVTEITADSIKYRLSHQPDGPIRNIDISEVFMVKYSDGTKEVFN